MKKTYLLAVIFLALIIILIGTILLLPNKQSSNIKLKDAPGPEAGEFFLDQSGSTIQLYGTIENVKEKDGNILVELNLGNKTQEFILFDKNQGNTSYILYDNKADQEQVVIKSANDTSKVLTLKGKAVEAYLSLKIYTGIIPSLVNCNKKYLIALSDEGDAKLDCTPYIGHIEFTK